MYVLLSQLYMYKLLLKIRFQVLPEAFHYDILKTTTLPLR